MGKGVRPKTCISPSAISASEKKQGENGSAAVGDITAGRRNSDPRGFANPTFSSLNKIKPVAIIKAYDDITDHRSLLDKTKILEKLRSTQIRSPFLDLRRQELEELVNTKSHGVIKNELDVIMGDAQAFVVELSARFGDASYRLDLAHSWETLDRATRTKAVQNFAAGADERYRLVSDLESKIRSWKEVIGNCKKILKVTSSDPPMCEITELIAKVELVLGMHQRSCFIWFSKIIHVNVQVMCHYFDQLLFSTISNVCSCRREFERIVDKFDMAHDILPTNEFQEIACLLAKQSAIQISCLFPESDLKNSLMKKVTFAKVSSSLDLFHEHTAIDDTEDGIFFTSFESIMTLIMVHCQRILLRLIFARCTPDEVKPTKKAPCPRKSWKLSEWGADDIQHRYKELDETFWTSFWTCLSDPIVSMFMEHDISVWPPLLNQMRNFCLTGNDLSNSSISSLSKAYYQLFKIYSEQTWSTQHRLMIHAMEQVCHASPESLVTEDKLSTTIGSFAISAIDPIVVLIRDCEHGTVPDGSIHCLTLSINTLINWINCEDMSHWPSTAVVIMIWGDLQSLNQALKSLGEGEKVVHFEQDVREVQETCMKQLLRRVSDNSRTLVKRTMPRSEYKSKVCKSTPSWMSECFEEAVSEIIETLNKLSMHDGVQVVFVNAFMDGCLAELVQEPVKFSESGARAFAHDAETLLTRMRQVTHADEADLLQHEQINNFLNFSRCITSGSPSVVTTLRMGSRIAPAGLVSLRKPHFMQNCFDCCYL